MCCQPGAILLQLLGGSDNIVNIKLIRAQFRMVTRVDIGLNMSWPDLALYQLKNYFSKYVIAHLLNKQNSYRTFTRNLFKIELYWSDWILFNCAIERGQGWICRWQFSCFQSTCKVGVNASVNAMHALIVNALVRMYVVPTDMCRTSIETLWGSDTGVVYYWESQHL